MKSVRMKQSEASNIREVLIEREQKGGMAASFTLQWQNLPETKQGIYN